MLDVLWGIITTGSIVVEWLVLKYILDKVIEKRLSNSTLRVMIIGIILSITILRAMNIDDNIKLYIGIIMAYTFCIYGYKTSFSKAIITNSVYWMLLLGFDALGVSIIMKINEISNIKDVLNNNILRVEATIVSKIFLTMIVPVGRAVKINVDMEAKDIVYISIPIITNILSVLLIFSYMIKKGEENNIQNATALILTLFMLLSNISLIFIMIRIIKNSKLKLENNVMKEKMDMQCEYYLKLQENQMRVRKLYHDMKNHMICVENNLKTEGESRNYIDNLKLEIDKCAYVFNTGNMILDTILNEKKMICDENNIEFIVDINFSKCKFVDMLDVCSIFSNILDNAIEACNRSKNQEAKRYIKARGTIIKGFFMLKVENSKFTQLNIENNNIITNKKDSFLHGLGISSIKNSVEKYNGELGIDYSKNKFTMSIYIPLQ